MNHSGTRNSGLQQKFSLSARPHIAMISNHGIHEWDIVPGLPDTGGQNVFVNQLSQALANNGYRITIFNRGGYPHPFTGKFRQGVHFRDEHQRLVYLTDSAASFITKEKMSAQIPELVESLWQFLAAEGDPPTWIISHYWDGAEIGRLAAASIHPRPIHLWIPHSLGRVKKHNVSPEKWPELAILERIQFEDRICSEVQAVVSTSDLIRQSLAAEYHVTKPILNLPPCIDTNRFYPRTVSSLDPIWDFISRHCSLSPAEVRGRKIITEISRTDSTKRKDVLIKAFIRVHERFPETLLMTSIDTGVPAGLELQELISGSGKGIPIAILSNVYEQLPTLYAVSSIYCTPSIMEGFGMSAQEAAAAGIPVVASERVPFAVEVLLGSQIREHSFDGASPPNLIGEGSIIVPADSIDGFTAAMDALLRDEELRSTMGKNAFEKTIPAFSWDVRIQSFLQQAGKLQSSRDNSH